MYPGMSSWAIEMLSLRSPMARTFPRVEYVWRGVLLDAARVPLGGSGVREQAGAGATNRMAAIAVTKDVVREADASSMAVVYHPGVQREMRGPVTAEWATAGTSWYGAGP